MSSALLGDSHGISVVDFKPFLDGSAREDVAKAILDSFKRIGFVYLVNHGIPPEKSKAMFEWVRRNTALPLISLDPLMAADRQSKRFFALPMDKKQLAPHPPSGTHHRGVLIYAVCGRSKN